ncbi:hypothetical protein J1N35_000849 [Gossypium stocksii]|uniref:Uncharacterized protein n=1 Tax=Gossypium stocksii TaxID=47602 RepID=A0A9D3WJ43_9ROSI|nr:hypothetical protein J1N35_000849 [Gossypium stocksii]
MTTSHCAACHSTVHYHGRRPFPLHHRGQQQHPSTAVVDSQQLPSTIRQSRVVAPYPISKFYAHLNSSTLTTLHVRGKEFSLSSTVITVLFSLLDVDDDDYSAMEANANEESIQDVLRIVTIPKANWKTLRQSTR